MKQKSSIHLSELKQKHITITSSDWNQELKLSPRISLKDIKDLKYNSSSLKINPEGRSTKQKTEELKQFSLGEVDNMSEISIDSEIGQKYYGKMEKLLSKSDLEEKTMKNEQIQYIGKQKYQNKFILKSRNKQKNQNYEQLFFQTLISKVKQTLSPIWKISIDKQFQIQSLESQSSKILSIISEWKSTNSNYQQNFQKLISIFGVDSFEEVLQKVQQKSIILEEKQSSLFKLSSTLQSQQSTLCLQPSKICYYDTNLLKQNVLLKQAIERLQHEKKQLTLTLEQDFGNIKSNIIEEVQSKIELTNSLIAAENYIVNLKKATDQEIETLQKIIQREREAMTRFMQTLPQLSGRKQIQSLARDNSRSLFDLQQTIQQQIRSCEYLSSKLDEAEQHIRYLQNLLQQTRKASNNYISTIATLQSNQNMYLAQKQYFKQQITNLNYIIKQSLSNNYQKNQQSTLQSQISKLNQNIHNLVTDYKTIKQKNKSQTSNVSYQEQIQKIIKNKAVKFHSLERSHALVRNQSSFSKPNNSNVSVPQKQNKRKAFERVRLSHAIDKIEPEILKNSKQNNLQSQLVEEDNSQYMNQLQKSYKRMKSMCFKSLNISFDDGYITDRSSKVNDNSSEISVCWKQTSSIQNLALRVDSQPQLSFQLQQLFQKYHLCGQIPTVIKSFLKKLPSQTIDKIQCFLSQLSQILNLQQFDRQNNELFLREQFDKMESIFKQIKSEQQMSNYNMKEYLNNDILIQEEESFEGSAISISC